MRAETIFQVLILLAAFVQAVAAQSANGYIAGGSGSSVQGAGGAELVIAQTIGIGGDFGFIDSHSSSGFASVDGSFHFNRHAATARVDPFVIGGYSRAFSIFSGANGANFGFGLNFWFAHHFGVRGEFRDMVFPGNSSTNNNWVIRGGIAFR